MTGLDITISRTSTSVGPGKPYTIYHIAIRTPSALRPILVQKRYSDFVALNNALTSNTGASPPAQIPAKSWFSRTVNNESLTEERRQGLEKYLQEIEDAADSRWRDSDVYREFLELGKNGISSGRGSVSGATGGLSSREPITTAAAWLDAHYNLKARLQEARLLLAKREQAQSATAQHEAGAGAKKSLVQAGTMIVMLDDGLERLSGKSSGGKDGGGWGAEKLGDGELRRRRDLLSTAKKERDGLEGVLNAMAVRSAVASITNSAIGGSGAASDEAKAGLFQGASSSTSQGIGGRGGRRVLGGPAKETERTRELDNEGVLQLQKQIMSEQDQDVQDLTKVVRRMKDMGIAINEELIDQIKMTEMLEHDVDRQVFLPYAVSVSKILIDAVKLGLTVKSELQRIELTRFVEKERSSSVWLAMMTVALAVSFYGRLIAYLHFPRACRIP